MNTHDQTHIDPHARTHKFNPYRTLLNEMVTLLKLNVFFFFFPLSEISGDWALKNSQPAKTLALSPFKLILTEPVT